MWRDDNERLIPYRANRSAFAFKDTLAGGIQAIQQRLGTRELPGAERPDRRPRLRGHVDPEVGGRRLELIAVPGGETTDSLVVWLPDERICLCGNTFGPIFGHIPNLVTIRGDRYRDALTAIASVERVRELQPELLVTGHFDPIAGADLIDAELTRLRDAIAVHPRPDRRRDERRQGRPDADARDHPARGHTRWAKAMARSPGTCGPSGRTTPGWFHHRSTTELYPVGFDERRPPTWSSWPAPTRSSIARAHHLAAGRPLHAIHLAELVAAPTTPARVTC